MTIETRLAELQNLKIGSTEGVVRDISQIESERIIGGDELDSTIDEGEFNYRVLIETKLPQILENLKTLSSFIYHLGNFSHTTKLDSREVCYSHGESVNFAKEEDNFRIAIRRDSQHLGLTRDYTFLMQFDSSKMLRQIHLFGPTRGWDFKQVGFSQRQSLNRLVLNDWGKNYLPFNISSSDPTDFAKKYADLVISDLSMNNDYNKRTIDLPILLNDVPQVVKAVYQLRKDNSIKIKSDRNSSLSSENSRIESLPVNRDILEG